MFHLMLSDVSDVRVDRADKSDVAPASASPFALDMMENV